jgi:regulator of protease activity HflC (stomatin/prohibitin superfamily)
MAINNYGGTHQNISGSPLGNLLRKYKWPLVVAAALLYFFLFCFRTVGAGAVGIVTRFGEVDRVATSGIAIKLPWPIERLEKMEVRVQKEELTATAATSDLQDINATLALNYALDNASALKVYKELGKDYKNRVVTPAVQESFKGATSQYNANQLITERAAVKGKAYDDIRSRLNKYGIRVVDLNIVDFKFSPAFSAAIEAKQVAQQQAAKAEQDLVRIEVEARQRVADATGQAEAQRLQQVTLTPELLQKAAIEKWDGKMPTTTAGGDTIFSIPIR